MHIARASGQRSVASSITHTHTHTHTLLFPQICLSQGKPNLYFVSVQPVSGWKIWEVLIGAPHMHHGSATLFKMGRRSMRWPAWPGLSLSCCAVPLGDEPRMSRLWRSLAHAGNSRWPWVWRGCSASEPGHLRACGTLVPGLVGSARSLDHRLWWCWSEFHPSYASGFAWDAQVDEERSMPGRLSQELVWPSWMQEADEHLADPGAAYSVPGDSAPPQSFMALEAEDRVDPR